MKGQFRVFEGPKSKDDLPLVGLIIETWGAPRIALLILLPTIFFEKIEDLEGCARKLWPTKHNLCLFTPVSCTVSVKGIAVAAASREGVERNQTERERERERERESIKASYLRVPPVANKQKRKYQERGGREEMEG
jgi:hypothetical protein